MRDDLRVSSSASKPVFTCHQCQAGVMNLSFLTYFTWLDDELVMVPNFPAWVCDVCGRREYDTRAVSWLSTLLSPNAGHGSPKRRLLQPRPRRRRSDHFVPPAE
jgi:YgiT-type zinc finger domain-containing protein